MSSRNAIRQILTASRSAASSRSIARCRIAATSPVIGASASRSTEGVSAPLSEALVTSRLLVTPRPLRSIVQSRCFSGSAARFGGGESDASLSSKLAEELSYELDSESAMAGQDPEWLAEFKESGVWSIVDKEGMDEVVLERTFGNETLRLTFSISDLDNPPDTSDLTEGETSPDTSTLADESTSAEPDAETDSFPIRCTLSLTKSGAGAGSPGGGALVMDLLVEDEAFVIDSASYYKDKRVAEDMSSEGDWKRRGCYVGPRFDHLDMSVQQEFEAFLEERDVNQTLAVFIPLYCEYKEQKEYVSWLGNVKNFIDQ